MKDESFVSSSEEINQGLSVMLCFGTAYYPEEMSRERIRYDAELMRDAGLRYVRMAEFAWSHMEPREGEFNFQWLHEAVDIFAEYGMKSILCTPSSAAPAWMCRKYPEILRMTRTGDRAWFGKRDHTCYTSSKYREFSIRMAQKMAESFRSDDRIYAWQIDNEPGNSSFPECFCPDCRHQFREFLRRKFGTLEELNRAWATEFWSGEFTDWEEIELDSYYDGTCSCCQYESELFRSAQQAEFIRVQADAIREIIPDAVIGTNNYGSADRYEGFEALDFSGNDLYHKYLKYNPDKQTRFRLRTDIYRGIRTGMPCWILETQIAPGWPVRDLSGFYLRFYIGHGYDHIFFFLWNNHPSGDEKDNFAVIGPSGIPAEKYEALKKSVHDTKNLLEDSVLPMPKPECALIFDYRAQWLYATGRSAKMIFMETFARENYNMLAQSAGCPDCISSEADFNSYKLLVFPIQPYVSEKLAGKLEAFVASGGVLVMNGRTGLTDEFAKNLPCSGPQHLQKLFGMTIGESMEMDYTPDNQSANSLPVFMDSKEFKHRNAIVSGTLAGKKAEGTLSLWTASLKTEGAEVLMSFENSLLLGKPFLTCNRFGKGYALYYAADAVNKELLHQIISYAAGIAGFTEEIPEGVDLIRRGNLLFVSNFNQYAVVFKTKYRGKNKLGHALSDGRITLEDLESAVIELGELSKYQEQCSSQL